MYMLQYLKYQTLTIVAFSKHESSQNQFVMYLCETNLKYDLSFFVKEKKNDISLSFIFI